MTPAIMILISKAKMIKNVFQVQGGSWWFFPDSVSYTAMTPKLVHQFSLIFCWWLPRHWAYLQGTELTVKTTELSDNTTELAAKTTELALKTTELNSKTTKLDAKTTKLAAKTGISSKFMKVLDCYFLLKTQCEV